MIRKNKGHSMTEPLIFLGILGSLIIVAVHSCTDDKEPIPCEPIKEQSLDSDLK
jgi:hypothetical protein